MKKQSAFDQGKLLGVQHISQNGYDGMYSLLGVISSNNTYKTSKSRKDFEDGAFKGADDYCKVIDKYGRKA